jgi:hypothetical protein
MDNVTGNVMVNKVLDRETVPEYDFTVVATNDCAKPPDSLDNVWTNSTLPLKIIVRRIVLFRINQLPIFETRPML